MDSSLLLQQYRQDRRKLLEFILSSSSNLIKQDQTPLSSSGSGDDVDLDTISVDYIIDCINKGRALDILEASNQYTHESGFPVTVDYPSGSSYFLCSNPELSGSPPLRLPPKVELMPNGGSSMYSSNQLDPLIFEEIVNSADKDGIIYSSDADEACQPVQDEYIPSLGLPDLETGFLKDCLMMICGKQLMNYCSVQWHFLGGSYILRKREMKRSQDFCPG